jgi:hypothetical protein
MQHSYEAFAYVFAQVVFVPVSVTTFGHDGFTVSQLAFV